MPRLFFLATVTMIKYPVITFLGVYKSAACSRTELSQAMLVVGYGTKSGRWLWDGDFWTLKNSWGTSWGEDGYMRVARNLNNMCGVATEASFPLL